MEPHSIIPGHGSGGTPSRIRAGSLAEGSQPYQDLAEGPFFDNNRHGQDPSRGTRDTFWLHHLQAGARNAYECIAASPATDFLADLDNVDVPTSVIHGGDQQVVPFEAGGKKPAERVAGAQLKVYPGAPHGVTVTHEDRLNNDLLEFLKS